MTKPPGQAEPGGATRTFAPVREKEGRDRGEMVRVCGVPKAQQQCSKKTRMQHSDWGLRPTRGIPRSASLVALKSSFSRHGRKSRLWPLPGLICTHERQSSRPCRIRISTVGGPSADSLVSLGPGGLHSGTIRQQTGPAGHWRGLVPLVSRHGRRIIRESRTRRLSERELYLHQSRPRRETRRGCPLPESCANSHPAGRLASHCVPDPEGRGLLRRHVLP